MERVLFVSSALPISVERKVTGLLAAMASVGEARGVCWLGRPGSLLGLDDEERGLLADRSEALGLAWITDAQEVEADRYSLAVLRPALHSWLHELPLEGMSLEPYRRLNQRFADAVVETYRAGDLVWVHGYQLMLVPRMVRAQRAGAAIGFSLDTPFPPAEIFQALSPRKTLVEGALSADLIGFRAVSHLRNFASSALRVLGAGGDVHAVKWQGQLATLGVFPMSVDARALQAAGEREVVRTMAASLKGPGRERLVVGVDELDDSRAIVRRVMAFEGVLAERPELAGQVRLVQVATPLRRALGSTAALRQELEVLVAKVNQRLGTSTWLPVECRFGAPSEEEYVALCLAADVLLLTPLGDDLELGAKRFVAVQGGGGGGDGVLVLSELSDEATELGEALRMNPYDVESVKRVISQAIDLGASERRTRMAALHTRVFEHDLGRWAASFVTQLDVCRRRAERHTESHTMAYSSGVELNATRRALKDASALILLLDYDGTLVPFTDVPQLAVPDAELIGLLEKLAARRETEVHVVSGRSSEGLERFFGRLDVTLHAEHGQFKRPPSGPWTERAAVSQSWRPQALGILRDFADRTPGSFVEEKRSGLAWHYRLADPEYGAMQARELATHLSAVQWNAPVEVLSGIMVVELRPHGANKGRVASEIVQRVKEGTLIAAFGDDRTDEDLFAALPDTALKVHVGPAASQAPVRLSSTAEVRSMLASILG